MRIDRDGNVFNEAGVQIGAVFKMGLWWQARTGPAGSDPIRVDGLIAWAKREQAAQALRRHVGPT